MNGNDDPLGQFNPTFLEDGNGIAGIGIGQPPFAENLLDWRVGATTQYDEPVEDQQPPGGAAGCMADAGDPPGSGTWILGSIDGTCQWIDTTICA